jgi:hypothetical protein
MEQNGILQPGEGRCIRLEASWEERIEKGTAMGQRMGMLLFYNFFFIDARGFGQSVYYEIRN